MNTLAAQTRSQARSLSRDSLRQLQLTRLNDLLTLLREHPLYSERLSDLQFPLTSLEPFGQLPILNKHELLGETRHAPSKLFTPPRDQYVRFHQTSGSRGWPLPVFDTASDWRWWLDCWQHVLDSADVTVSDVAFMAFSFGPFIGFWTANDALVDRGTLVVPGGGLSSLARLSLIQEHDCTVLCCTPTYALHLASVAVQQGIDLKANTVTRIIVAGEPGGSIPAVREAIESQWDARVIDHAGASEVGAWGFACRDASGLHILETEFLSEFLILDEQQQVIREAEEGEACELVLTNLGRRGGPVLRYRTGDVVRPIWNHGLDCSFVKLDGGVIGRADDMLIVRGVNIFPSSVESIIREIEPTAEFRMVATREASMDQLRVEIECERGAGQRLAEQLQERLAMRVPVKTVAVGSLLRFETKAKRWIDQRDD